MVKVIGTPTTDIFHCPSSLPQLAKEAKVLSKKQIEKATAGIHLLHRGQMYLLPIKEMAKAAIADPKPTSIKGIQTPSS
jgi:hypothetical protein